MRLVASQLEMLRAVDAAQGKLNGCRIWVDRYSIADSADCAPGDIHSRMQSLIRRGLVETELESVRWYRLSDQGRAVLEAMNEREASVDAPA
jgi:hypothetical protein